MIQPTVKNNLLATMIAIALVIGSVLLHFNFAGDLETINAQDPPGDERRSQQQSQHECEDNPSGPNCPAYGRLRASHSIANIGEEIEVTAYDLFNLGSSVRFGLLGPLSFTKTCSDRAVAGQASESSLSEQGSDNVLSWIAKTKVYGCTPGGTGTIRLSTKEGVLLHSITVEIRLTTKPYGQLRASPASIDIGGSTLVTAFDLLNVGNNVTFALTGYLSFTSTCSDAASDSTDNVVRGTAKLTVYGCAPGGTSAVILRTRSGIELDRLSILVYPTPEPYGELSASKNTIDIGVTSKVFAYDLRNFGKHVRFNLIGPVDHRPNCGKSDFAASSSPVPPDDTSRVIYTARMTVYGCFPGGVGVVQLTTAGGDVVESISIKVNPTTKPHGEVIAALTEIEPGQGTEVLAFNLFNVGDHVAFSLAGPISFNPYCLQTLSADANTAYTQQGGTARRTIYGCLPGGNATLRVYATTGNYDLLASVTIKVKRPSTYASLIPAPGPAVLCAGFGSLHRSKLVSDTAAIMSYGGYMHTVSHEIWESRPSKLAFTDLHCIEARITNISTPGATESQWTGTLYETRPLLTDDNISINTILNRTFSDFLKILRYQNPKTEGVKANSKMHSCQNCRGGTIQTNQHRVDAKLFLHRKMHLFSEHTIRVGDQSQTIALNSSAQVSTTTFETTEEFVRKVVSELLDIFTAYASEKLQELARWIFTNI